MNAELQASIMSEALLRTQVQAIQHTLNELTARDGFIPQARRTQLEKRRDLYLAELKKREEEAKGGGK